MPSPSYPVRIANTYGIQDYPINGLLTSYQSLNILNVKTIATE